MPSLGSSAVAASIGTTVCLVAPIAAHRMLFRKYRIENVATAAHCCAIAGLWLLGIALTGVAVLVFDTVGNTWAGMVAGIVFGSMFAGGSLASRPRRKCLTWQFCAKAGNASNPCGSPPALRVGGRGQAGRLHKDRAPTCGVRPGRGLSVALRSQQLPAADPRPFEARDR
ncbi:DUF6328 family protein [Nocardia tengchongensis]|uniref:DUF6328 family protein n=1 Tax=Nocardia tengchongensis TaxID=2055889 RepID=UPI00368CC7E6